MSMTFLQMASRARQECRGSGTGPTSVTSQTGEYKRIVDWIINADEDVQRKSNHWKFMVGSFTLNTVASTASYLASACVTPVTDLRDWRTRTLKIYLLSAGTAGETNLVYMDYQQWYETYNTGTQTTGRPRFFTIGNDMSLNFGPVPDAVYRVSGEYQKSVDTLSASSDVPVYPAEYHMLPVWATVIAYGEESGSAELVARGTKNYNQMMRQMERTQLPKMILRGPMV